MGTRVVTATDFKANSAAYPDAIGKDGETITITRRGCPVAVLSPAQKPVKVKKRAWGSSMGSWAGRMRIVGDIVNTSDLYAPPLPGGRRSV